MTLNTGYTSNKHIGNGVSTEFTYDFESVYEGSIKVYLRVDGAIVEQTEGFTYTWSSSGGIVTFEVPPVSGQEVVIGRVTEDSQEVPLKTSQGFQATVIEKAFDKLTAIAQENKEDIARCITLDKGIDADEFSLTLPVPDAGKALMWNADGSALVTTNTNIDDLENTVAETLRLAQEARDESVLASQESEASAVLSTAQVELAKQEVAKATAEVESAAAQADRSYDEAERAKEYAESIDPESLKVKTVFSINEASKDASGNPNFMSVSGDQITFNGAVKYTQANGESVEKASVSPIALTSGYVMLNNGVASVVPALEVQQSEPVGNNLSQPTFTSNVATDGFTIISNLTNDDLYTLYNGVSSAYDVDLWSECVLGLGYTSALKLVSYTLQADSNGAAEHPIEWYVEGSDDGANWVEVDYRNDEDFNVGESRVFEVSTEYRFKSYRIRFIRGVESAGSGELKKIEFKFLELQNQTVWFNPYNNQAKQYNGTDWVDYNGVPVGTITDAVAYNYQYNTQKNVEPFVYIATNNTKAEVVSWGMPDYSAGVTITSPFITPSEGYIAIMCGQGDNAYTEVFIDNISLGYTRNSDAGGASTQTRDIFVARGREVKWGSNRSGSKFFPLKGAI